MPKVNIEFDLAPFPVPPVVREKKVNVYASDDSVRHFELEELSPEVLEEMCEDFIKAVFAKAKKLRPVKIAPTGRF
jgi:hypothetical protein